MKRTLSSTALFASAYLALEWLFTRMTLAEGLVTPRGTPNVGVIAIGASYLTLRLIVRLVLPGAVAFAVVGGILSARRP